MFASAYTIFPRSKQPIIAPIIGLVATLVIHVPGMEREKVREFAEAAHLVCPYSRATRGNISVELRVL